MTTSRHLTECVLAGIPVADGKIQRHPHQTDPHSGSGNCVCGAPERHHRHPHMFLRAMNRRQVCTCGLPPEDDRHLISLTEVTPL